MRFGSGAVRVTTVLAILALYLTVVWMGLTEESRRSLAIRGPTPASDDYVTVNLRVTSVDTAQGLLHGRIRIIPTGRFAEDQATPASDLTLLINSVAGKQTVVFPAGERVYPVEFSSLLAGNQNRYPFDRYVSDIEILVTAATPKPPPVPPEIPLADNMDPLESPLIVGNNALVGHGDLVAALNYVQRFLFRQASQNRSTGRSHMGNKVRTDIGRVRRVRSRR